MIKPLRLLGSVTLFAIPAIIFFLLTHYLIPYLTVKSGIHPALSWFIAGSIMFIPLFITAVIMGYNEGFTSVRELKSRLRLKKMSNLDWKYAIISSLAVMLLTGLIMGISKWLHSNYNFPLLESAPDFMRFEPFEGREKLLFFPWLFMFFFNMFGEELLWRGYILPRQEMAFQNRAWIVNAALWMLFHVCFGFQLMLILIPILTILPYAVYKTKNTYVGLFIHAIINGPAFVLVALGLIK